MNKIEMLIKKFCPNGVKFEELRNKELFNFYYGKGNKIPEDIGGIYDVYGANGVVSHINEYNCEDISIIGHIGAVGLVNRCKGKCFVTYNGTIAEVVDKTKVDTQYFYYVLTTLNLELYKKGNQPFLSVSDFENIRIPIPPLEVQKGIANILDNFTDLITELMAELKARQEQYEYYRDKLIFNNARGMKLKELLKIKNGRDYKSFESGDIPVYGTGGIIAYTSKIAYDKPTVLIPRKGSINKLYYVDTPFWNVDTIFYTEINQDIILPKYLFYSLESEHLENLNTAGGVPSLTQTVLNEVEICVPTIEEQRKIVEKLDKMYNHINNVSEGLPAEIEERQVQYNYYKNKLLNFKEM